MKIALVTSRVPLPALTGDRVRAIRLIDHLRADHEVHLVCFGDPSVDGSVLRDLEARVRSVRMIPLGRYQLARNGLRAIFGRTPIQAGIYRSKEMEHAVEELVVSEDIDVVVAQLARISPNITGGDVPMVLDFVDALSLGFGRRAAKARWYTAGVLSAEAKRLRRLERQEGTRARARVVTSPVDADHLQRLGAGEVHVVPVGVGDDFFEGGDEPVLSRTDLVFTGNLGYAANVAAAEYLANEIVPRVAKHRPDLRVQLVGARPARRVRRLSSDTIEVVGPVPDVRSYLRGARVAVAPMTTGSGVQLKLLEAMAMGIPVVTTSLAAEPLGATAGFHLLTGDDPAAFADAVVRLLSSEELSQQVGDLGRRYVEDHFRWERVNAGFEHIITTAAGAR